LTEPLQVGQFGIVDHEPVDRGPNAGFFQGRGPAEDRAELFAVAEGTTPAGEGFAGHVVSAIGQAWAEFDMSVTGSLQRVFEEAARNVDDWNRKSIAQHRVSLGLSCFAHRGDQAVLAQAGPTVAFHLHGRRLITYAPSGPSLAAIGGGEPVEPELSRVDFGASDRLLLVSTTAAAELDDDVVAGILALPGEQALQDLYHRVRHLRHATVLLVTGGAGLQHRDDRAIPVLEGAEANETEEVVIDATIDTPGGGYQPSLFISDDREDELAAARARLLSVASRLAPQPVVPAVANAELTPLRRVAGESVLAQLAAQQRAAAAASQHAVGAATVSSGHPGRPGWLTPSLAQASDSPRFEARRASSFTRGLAPASRPATPEPAASTVPLASEMADGRRTQTRESRGSMQPSLDSAQTLAGAGPPLVRPRSNMGGRWKGGGSLSGRRTMNRQQLPPTWLVIVVGLGLLLTLVGALTVPGLLDPANRGDAEQLVNRAEQELATARVQEDPAAKRAGLTRAQALLLEAQAAGGVDTLNQGLVNEVAGALADLDAVVQPAAVESIADLSQFGQKPVTPSHIVAGGGAIYLLDAASAQVIAVDAGGGEPTVVYQEAPAAGQGRPVAIAFVQSPDLGDPGGLVIIDANRALWVLDEIQGLRPAMFNLPAKAVVTDATGYGGELYVLDTAESRVLRFSPVGGEFSRDPEIVLDSPELAQAARIMFDGEVVTSDIDGSLHRFSGQLWLELSQAGIDRPLTSAQAPQSFADGDQLAVLDPEGDRIIVLLRDGTFARQYQDPAFTGISAFGTADGSGIIFAGGEVRRVTW